MPVPTRRPSTGPISYLTLDIKTQTQVGIFSIYTLTPLSSIRSQSPIQNPVNIEEEEDGMTPTA